MRKLSLSLKKPTGAEVRKFVLYFFIVCLGNACAACASGLFLIPNGFVMGGVTGIGILVRNLIGEGHEWVVECTVYVANIALFIVGALLLGKRFALATLAGTLLYPLFLSLFTYVNGLYVESTGHPIAADEPVLAALFGAMLFGAGLGIVVRVGASTGGTDIPPLILNHYFGFPVAVTLWMIDGSIVLLQLVAVSFQAVMYGIVIDIVSSLVISIVSPVGTRRAQVFIVSKKFHEIRDMILYELNRGTTLLQGETGFLHEECRMLMTVVSRREVVRLKNEVRAIDPDAFFTVTTVSEVRGRGFTAAKVQLPPASAEDAQAEDRYKEQREEKDRKTEK